MLTHEVSVAFRPQTTVSSLAVSKDGNLLAVIARFCTISRHMYMVQNLAMTAGIKTLELLKQEGTYEKLEAITKKSCWG